MYDSIENDIFKISQRQDKVSTVMKSMQPMGFNRGKFTSKTYYGDRYVPDSTLSELQPVLRDQFMPHRMRKARRPYWYRQGSFGLPRGINEAELRLLGNSVWVQRCKSIIIDETLSAKYEFIPQDEKDFTGETNKLMSIAYTFFKAVNREGDNIKEVCKPYMNDMLDLGFGVMTKGYRKDAYIPLRPEQTKVRLRETAYPDYRDLTYVPTGLPEGMFRSLEAHDAAQFYKHTDYYGGEIGWWQYLNDGIPIFFSKREIISTQMFSTTYSPYGISPVESIKNMVNVLVKSVENTDDYMENGAIPPGFIALTEISETEFDIFQSRWKATVEGNPSEIPLISSFGGKIEFQPLVVNTQDIKQLDAIDVYQKIVMSVFHVTPAELGITDAVNKSSADQQSAVQKRAAIFPFLDRLEDMINRSILREIDPHNRIKFQWIRPKSVEEETAELGVWQKKFEMGVAVPNDYMKTMGLPTTAWGNVPFNAAMWIGLAQQFDPSLFGLKEQAEDISQSKIDFTQRQISYLLEQMQYSLNNNASVTPTMIDVMTRLNLLKEGLNQSGMLRVPTESVIEAEQMIDSVTRNNQFSSTAEIFNEFQPHQNIKALPPAQGKNLGMIFSFFQANKDWFMKPTKTTSKKYKAKYFKKLSPFERLFVSGMRMVFGSWADKILGLVEQLPDGGVVTQNSDMLLDALLPEVEKAMNKEEMYEAVMPSFVKAYRMGNAINNNGDVKPSNIKFELSDPKGMDWMRQRSFKFADDYINQFSARLKDMVIDAYDRNMGLEYIVKQMGSIVPTERRDGETIAVFRERQKKLTAKLRRIARTETAMAANRGRYNQMKETGVTHWQHRTFFDSKNAPSVEKPFMFNGKMVTCRTQHGKIYPIDDTSMMPVLHVNCRCAIHAITRFSAKTMDEVGAEPFVPEKINSADNDCVSRKIRILKDEHPEWDHDRHVAVAINMCKENEESAKTGKSVDREFDSAFDEMYEELKVLMP